MRVGASVAGSRLTLMFTPSGADELRVPRSMRSFYGGPRPAHGTGGSMRLKRREASFALPAGWSLERLHPDVLALASAFLVIPFIRARLESARPVSPAFAAEFERLTEIEVGPI